VGWDRLVFKGGIVPDEGLCMAILHCLASTGQNLELGNQIIAFLKQSFIKVQEYHIAPILLCLEQAQPDDIGYAFALLHLMAEEEITPTGATTQPVVRMLYASNEIRTHAIEWLKTKATSAKNVSIHAWNCLIAAQTGAISSSSITPPQLQQAISLLHDADSFGISPDTRTYNLLLRGCMRLKHPEMGKNLYRMMLDRSVERNGETHERLILLTLFQEDYEDAFLHLEQMQTERFVPSALVLMAMARKCAGKADARWRTCVQRMERLGYPIDEEWLQSIMVRPITTEVQPE
jgi:pentatricopeptide repeat protein